MSSPNKVAEEGGERVLRMLASEDAKKTRAYIHLREQRARTSVRRWEYLAYVAAVAAVLLLCGLAGPALYAAVTEECAEKKTVIERLEKRCIEKVICECEE